MPIDLTIAGTTTSSPFTIDPAHRALGIFLVGSHNDFVHLEFALTSGAFPGYRFQTEVGSGDWRISPTSAGVVAVIARPPTPWARLRTPTTATSLAATIVTRTI